MNPNYDFRNSFIKLAWTLIIFLLKLVQFKIMKFKGCCVFCCNGNIYGYILGCTTNSATHDELVR